MARHWHPSTSRGVSSLGEAAVHPQGGINASDAYDIQDPYLTSQESSKPGVRDVGALGALRRGFEMDEWMGGWMDRSVGRTMECKRKRGVSGKKFGTLVGWLGG